MNNIVVAFPKAEIAKSIKRILAQSGYSVSAVTSTGASTLTCMQGLDSGNSNMRLQIFGYDVQRNL